MNQAANISSVDGPSNHSIAPESKPARLKIALLGYRSHPFVGGQGIYLRYLSRALQALGHEVHVLSGQPYPKLDEGIRLIKIPGLNLYENERPFRALRFHHFRSKTDIQEWWGKASGAFVEPYCFGRRVEKYLRNKHYDIIHDNQSLSSALLKLQRQGKAVITTVHHPIHLDRDIALAAAESWGHRTLIRRWYNFLKMQQNVISKLHHVVTVSKTSQQDIAKHFSRPEPQTPIIFNGIDTNLFRPLPESSDNAFQILSTASSDQPLKGLSILLRAMDQLRTKFPNIELHLIGKLEKNGANEKLIKQLKLEKHIRCSHSLSNSELVQAYNQACLVVCPSLYEGFGLPAGEAMACEKAVIGSRSGALPEVIGDAGILFEAGNSLELSEKISELFSNKTLRNTLGKSARKRIEKTFSWQKVALEFEHYYYTKILN
ncbi:MAG: glycosyltransferase involved in cell wall biosynthesis [Flavobacteriales bacterium]|jgi:glycosyltransferase involved in cell wall biosynthesis